jgi:hypothetical protein
MTSIINSSNTNSALIQTVEAGDSMVNPNIYNVKEVYPTYAQTWVQNHSVNGSAKASQTSNFNLQKYGIIQQILLTFDKTYTMGGSSTALKIEAGDIFNTIDKVELLSSSRVVSILTAADLAAQFSNLTNEEYGVVYRTCLGPREPAGDGSSASVVTEKFVVPLHFGFMDDINTNLNSSFLETLSIRISWGANPFNHSFTPGSGADATLGTVTAGPELGDLHLSLLYKSLPEAPTAKMIAENFSRDSLIQVATRYYDENPVYYNADSTSAAHSVSVELKNTDCVESFFIMVREDSRAIDAAAGAHNAGLGRPMEIKSVTLSGSGQQMIKLDTLEIPYTKMKDNGWCVSNSLAATASDGAELFYVVKLQNGLYDNGGARLSNTMSLREINAAKIDITFATVNTKKYRIDVVENCTAIYQIASNTGRLSLALSN